MGELDRQKQRQQASDKISALLTEKSRRLKIDLESIDLTRDVKTPLTFFETEICLRSPDKVSLTDDEKLEALNLTEGFYKEKGIEIPQKLVNYRQLLVK